MAGKLILNLDPMYNDYAPSTVLFAQNLNESFTILSELLYGTIDGIFSFYGRGSEETDPITYTRNNISRASIAQSITQCLSSSYTKDNKTKTGSLFSNTNGSIQLRIDTSYIRASAYSSYINISNGTINLNPTSSSYVSLKSSDLQLVIPNGSMKVTSTEVSSTFNTNTYLKLETSGLTLRFKDDTKKLVLNDNGLTITVGNSKTLSMDTSGNATISGNLIVSGTDATVSGGRLVHSPATADNKTQIKSIWYGADSTLYFDV